MYKALNRETYEEWTVKEWVNAGEPPVMICGGHDLAGNRCESPVKPVNKKPHSLAGGKPRPYWRGDNHNETCDRYVKSGPKTVDEHTREVERYETAQHLKINMDLSSNRSSKKRRSSRSDVESEQAQDYRFSGAAGQGSGNTKHVTVLHTLLALAMENKLGKYRGDPLRIKTDQGTINSTIGKAVHLLDDGVKVGELGVYYGRVIDVNDKARAGVAFVNVTNKDDIFLTQSFSNGLDLKEAGLVPGAWVMAVGTPKLAAGGPNTLIHVSNLDCFTFITKGTE
ncbi:hypothetical protein [Actinotignum sp. GS-2025c]|uniref:hypothetical protein n=1 Tax=Actinotignum sp. GS-2025c TaxID=3427276 RepID=UPI003F46CE51